MDSLTVTPLLYYIEVAREAATNLNNSKNNNVKQQHRDPNEARHFFRLLLSIITLTQPTNTKFCGMAVFSGWLQREKRI